MADLDRETFSFSSVAHMRPHPEWYHYKVGHLAAISPQAISFYIR
jgi:hypothetical protein